MTGSFLTDRSDSFPGGRRRRAFTLVEMIVVMAIIGVLAAILIPTLRAAMVRAKVTAIAGDLANLDAALNQFKEKYGNYPPDFSPAPGTTLVQKTRLITGFVRKAWPRITVKEMNIFLAITVTHPDWRVDQAEALVFWLSGFSEDPLHPFTGPGGPFSNSGSERNQDNAFFPFDNNRLTVDNKVPPTQVSVGYGGSEPHIFIARPSIDEELLFGPGIVKDPFPVCLTRGTNLPIVYLDALNYLNSEYSVSLFPGHAHAYLSDRKLLNVNAGFEWINPHSYQLITAGLDEDFGLDVIVGSVLQFKQFESGANYVAGDLDNITNFSGGTLEDAIP